MIVALSIEVTDKAGRLPSASEVTGAVREVLEEATRYDEDMSWQVVRVFQALDMEALSTALDGIIFHAGHVREEADNIEHTVKRARGLVRGES